jgi:nucleoid-associated protein YgaU
MKRCLVRGLLFLAVCAPAVFGQNFFDSDMGNVRNNQYFVESVRLTNLAQEALEFGDYDASAQYAAEALRYARLSDEYVALQLRIRETGAALNTARTILDWAEGVKAQDRYPNEYRQASAAWEEALDAQAAEDWDRAIRASRRVINSLALVEGNIYFVGLSSSEDAPAPAPSPVPPVSGASILPARYTVRTWAESRDCFWNIAARPWVYGDPYKWRILYNANRSKLPRPDNPNILEPGIVLDIPSIGKEKREGMWDPNRSYTRH